MSAKPTAEQMDLAEQLYRQAHDAEDHPEPWLAVLAIARALAAAVTAEREKVRAEYAGVVDKLTDIVLDRTRANAYRFGCADAIELIREVSS